MQLLFARDVYDQLDMTVERVGNNEAGYKLLVLSCDKYMQNVTLLRQQSADVVFNSYQGLRVPKDAVRVEDVGQTGVYVLEGATARWKPITILHDNGESYVVELDKTSTANLWPGDEIIITPPKPFGSRFSTGCSAFIVKLNFFVAYFCNRKIAAVRIIAITLIAAAKP